MYFNQPIVNSMLSGAIEAMKTDPSDKSRTIVMEEILKARFLCPATVSMPPVEGENGELDLPDGCVIHQQMVQDSKGRPLLLAFTCQEQMQKWQERSGCQEVYSFSCVFLEYAELMLHKQPDGTYGPAQGFVIDPYGANLVVDRDMVANLLVRLQARK